MDLKLTRQVFVVPFSKSVINDGICVGKAMKTITLPFAPYIGLRLKSLGKQLVIKQLEYDIDANITIAICNPFRLVCPEYPWTMIRNAQEKTKIKSLGWELLDWNSK